MTTVTVTSEREDENLRQQLFLRKSASSHHITNNAIDLITAQSCLEQRVSSQAQERLRLNEDIDRSSENIERDIHKLTKPSGNPSRESKEDDDIIKAIAVGFLVTAAGVYLGYQGYTAFCNWLRR